MNDPNIITLYADESQEDQLARLHALAADPATCFFAPDDHDRDDLPDWPLPADVWVWSIGDRWVATVAAFHADDWWEGADPEDIAARPDPWFRPITDVPTTGRLEYVMRDGRDMSTNVSPPGEPDIVTSGTRAVLDALQPHEWWHTDVSNVIVVSLDGNEALRLTVDPATLPTESAYDTDDNRYPDAPFDPRD